MLSNYYYFFFLPGKYDSSFLIIGAVLTEVVPNAPLLALTLGERQREGEGRRERRIT